MARLRGTAALNATDISVSPATGKRRTPTQQFRIDALEKARQLDEMAGAAPLPAARRKLQQGAAALRQAAMGKWQAPASSRDRFMLIERLAGTPEPEIQRQLGAQEYEAGTQAIARQGTLGKAVALARRAGNTAPLAVGNESVAGVPVGAAAQLLDRTPMRSLNRVIDIPWNAVKGAAMAPSRGQTPLQGAVRGAKHQDVNVPADYLIRQFPGLFDRNVATRALAGGLGTGIDLIGSTLTTPTPQGIAALVRRAPGIGGALARGLGQAGAAAGGTLQNLAGKLEARGAGGAAQVAALGATHLTGEAQALNQLFSESLYNRLQFPNAGMRNTFGDIIKDIRAHPQATDVDRWVGQVITASESKAADRARVLAMAEDAVKRARSDATRTAARRALSAVRKTAAAEIASDQHAVLSQVPQALRGDVADFVNRIQRGVYRYSTVPALKAGLIDPATARAHGAGYLPRAYPDLDLALSGKGQAARDAYNRLGPRGQQIVDAAKERSRTGEPTGTGRKTLYDKRSEDLINEGTQPYSQATARISEGVEPRADYANRVNLLKELKQNGNWNALVRDTNPGGWWQVPSTYPEIGGKYVAPSEAGAQILQLFGITRPQGMAGDVAGIGRIGRQIGDFFGFRKNATIRRPDFAARQAAQGFPDVAINSPATKLPIDPRLHAKVARGFGRADNADWQRALKYVPELRSSLAEEAAGTVNSTRAALQREVNPQTGKPYLPPDSLGRQALNLYDVPMGKLGAQADQRWKFYAFLDIEDMLRKQNPNWTAEQVSRKAGQVAERVVYSGAHSAPALGRQLQALNVGPFPAAGIYRLWTLRNAVLKNPAALNFTTYAAQNMNQMLSPEQAKALRDRQGTYGDQQQDPLEQNIYLPALGRLWRFPLDPVNTADVSGFPSLMHPASLWTALTGPAGAAAITMATQRRVMPSGETADVSPKGSMNPGLATSLAAMGNFAPGLFQPAFRALSDATLQGTGPYNVPTGLRDVLLATLTGGRPEEPLDVSLGAGIAAGRGQIRDLRSGLRGAIRTRVRALEERLGRPATDAEVNALEDRSVQELVPKVVPQIEQKAGAVGAAADSREAIQKLSNRSRAALEGAK